MEGTGLHYQLAVSDCALTFDMRAIREAQPDLPVSGDQRSGVVLLDGNKPVGSFTINGGQHYEGQRLVVHEDYRRRGLAQRMIFEWYRRTKRQRIMSRQTLNPRGAKAFVLAQLAVCEWAVAQGHAVPDPVREEVETKAETSRILELIDEVGRTGNPVTLSDVRQAAL